MKTKYKRQVLKECDELLNRSCELLCELEESNKYFYDFDGGEEQKKIVDKFFEDVKKHNEKKESYSLCIECDNYLDYSELKDKMCSKCGETLK
tara:strand:- start:111 stop:389 length:279 start_codon:yes stop_codon:yes gene_type:complete